MICGGLYMLFVVTQYNVQRAPWCSLLHCVMPSVDCFVGQYRSCLGMMSYVAASYVIVARCPGSGARWFSLIVLLPAPVDRISSCVDLLVV